MAGYVAAAQLGYGMYQGYKQAKRDKELDKQRAQQAAELRRYLIQNQTPGAISSAITARASGRLPPGIQWQIERAENLAESRWKGKEMAGLRASERARSQAGQRFTPAGMAQQHLEEKALAQRASDRDIQLAGQRAERLMKVQSEGIREAQSQFIAPAQAYNAMTGVQALERPTPSRYPTAGPELMGEGLRGVADYYRNRPSPEATTNGASSIDTRSTVGVDTKQSVGSTGGTSMSPSTAASYAQSQKKVNALRESRADKKKTY